MVEEGLLWTRRTGNGGLGMKTDWIEDWCSWLRRAEDKGKPEEEKVRIESVTPQSLLSRICHVFAPSIWCDTVGPALRPRRIWEIVRFLTIQVPGRAVQK